MTQAAYRGKQVLITGHTGFKGAWLTQWLLELGADVVGYSLPEAVSEPNLFSALNLHDHCHDIRGDIRDKETLACTLADMRPNIIFHLAAQPLVRLGYDQPAATFEINTLGTVNLLEAVMGCPSVQAIVVVTSDKVYRNTGKSHSFTEDAPLGGGDPYSASKAAAEMVVDAYRALPALPKTVTVRAGNVVGGGDWGQNRLLPDIVRALLAESKAVIRNPTMTRPWQHVMDCLYGYLSVGEAILTAPDKVAKSYNIGPLSKRSMNVGDIADLCVAAWGRGSWVDGHHLEEGSVKEASMLALDSTAIKRDIGWQPIYDCGTAVRKSIEWYQAFYEKEDAKSLLARQIAAFAVLADG